MKLYELTEEWQRLQMWMEEEDADEDQALKDTFEAVKEDFADKADSYGMVSRNLDAHSAEIKAQEDILMEEVKRLRAYRARIDKNNDRLKESFKQALELTGQNSLKTDKFCFGTRKSSSVVIDAENVYEIPDECLRYKDPEPDKTAIKDWLKDHPDATWAHIETKTTLTIK